NSSAVRRGLFRKEEDKCFLIRQICGVSKNVVLGGLSEQRPVGNASSPSLVQRPSRIKHRHSFGLVFSCQGFCNPCQPRGLALSHPGDYLGGRHKARPDEDTSSALCFPFEDKARA